MEYPTTRKTKSCFTINILAAKYVIDKKIANFQNLHSETSNFHDKLLVTKTTL